MEIGMANPAEDNVDLEVGRPGIAAFEGKRGERGSGGFCRVGFGWIHIW
jgi:hypothetical protein